MRRYLIVILCLTTAAVAAPDQRDKKLKAIDAKPVLDKLVVFRDELGGFYVVPAPDSFPTMDEAGKWVFYGDAKAIYQQRMISSSVTHGKHYEWGLWAPRSKIHPALIELVDDKLTLECDHKKPRPLTQLKADETKTFLAKVTFYPELWQRQAKFLARDDDGVYYYVDELREEYGGNGFRVFVGLKGSMKELPMTNMVSDSAGEIYATKTGQLKIIADKDHKAFWIKGGKKTELTVLEPMDNRYLIYRDLGIYGSLGAVCDDL
jgi:hypothetical protein